MLLVLLLSLLPAARGLAADGCVVRDTFVALNFAEASLLRAFLGGQACRCAAGEGEEVEGLELQTEATPHDGGDGAGVASSDTPPNFDLGGPRMQARAVALSIIGDEKIA